MDTIREDIKNQSFKRVYLLYGEENYLKNDFKEKIRAGALADPSDTMNCTIFTGDNIDIKEVFEMAGTMPFFAERRVVVVDRAGWFKGKKKKDDEAEEAAEETASGDQAYLLQELPNIPDTTVLILVEDEADKRSKAFKAVKSLGYECEMKTPGPDMLAKWIAKQFAGGGRRITRETADYLINYCGSEMDNLVSEINKLIYFTDGKDMVVPKDIDQICTRQLQAVIFDLTDCISNGDVNGAMNIYNELIAKKESVFGILAMLMRNFEQLIVAGELEKTDQGGRVMEVLGLKMPFIANKIRGQARRFNTKALRDTLELAVQLDQDVKTGDISQDRIIELVIIAATKSRK